MTQKTKNSKLKALQRKFKRRLTKITGWLEANVVEYVHVVLMIVPIIAGFLALVFEKEGIYLAGGLVVIAIFINILLLSLRSELEKNNDLTLFYTLLRDELKPPKRARGELELTTDIALVEDKTHAYLAHALANHFKSKQTTGGEKLPIILRPVLCDPLETKADDQDQKEDRINTLSKALSKAEAVAVVRTEELDNNPWVYEAVIAWACKNADIPILFLRPKRRDQYPTNEIADKFLWISDSPKLLPWGLLTRAVERSSAWRTQARYNRAMVVNVLFLSLMIIHVGYLWINHQKESHDVSIQSMTNEYMTKVQEMYEGFRIRADAQTSTDAVEKLTREYGTSIKGIHEALETKAKYQNSFLSTYDETLNVSYWIRHHGQPHVFVTTESEPTRNTFPNEKGSIIGCGFVSLNRIVIWDNTEGTNVFDFETDQPINDHGCGWMPRAEKIGSIACSAFQSSVTGDPKATVGICVFSADENSILRMKYRDFLREETKSFYKTFQDSIEQGTMIPLSERLKSEKAAIGTAAR